MFSVYGFQLLIEGATWVNPLMIEAEKLRYNFLLRQVCKMVRKQ